MFDIQELLHSAAPGDMEIGVVRKSFYRSPEWMNLLRFYPDARLVMKYRDGGADVPETVTVEELRVAVKVDAIDISIDDGRGGLLEDA